jgi:prepilin-type N-terminal cleavage/methylation domain-containing protein
VRWPAGRILKQGRGRVDPSPVDTGFRDRKRSRPASEHGFTLIEVLVAALITLILSAGVATALISSTDYTGYERTSSQAQAVAQQDQERLKSMTDSQLTALNQTRTVTSGGSVYTVLSTATFLNASGTSSCTSDSTAYFKIETTVTGGASTAPLAKVETIIARPLAGSLVVAVDDPTAAPLSGVSIGVVGQNTNYAAGATTDANGCVAFAGLPTDTYTINATDPGFVNPNGATTATESANVNQNGVTAANTLFLGAAGNARVGFRTVGSNGVIYDGNTTVAGHGVAPNAYDLSYYGQGNGLQMTNAACLLISTTCSPTGSPTAYSASNTTNVTTIQAGSLFPFYMSSTAQYANNYQAWAGGCSQEQPLQPPSGTDFGTIIPGEALPSGGATDVTVDEPAIDVAVKYGTSTVLPADVTITFTGKNASGTVTCTDVWHKVTRVGTETVSGTTYATYPAPFASTAAAGSSNASNNGLPGTISICADYSGHDQLSSSFTNTNFTGATIAPVMTLTSTGTCT